MDETLREMELAISWLVKLARDAGDSGDSMRFSQSALNLVNAWARMKEAPKAPIVSKL